MQALVSVPAGQAFPRLSLRASLSSHSTVGCSYSPPSRPLSVHLKESRVPLCSRFSTKHSFPIGKRVFSHHRLRIAALQASEKSVKWILEPVGDGDTSHLDEAVPLPGSFELASDAATVGRVAGKADIVIPVATVSGLHARLEKREGALFVTDLDSTNGTYIDDKKIRPGAVSPVFPGSYITFGDEHLAVFRFSKVEEGTAQS